MTSKNRSDEAVIWEVSPGYTPYEAAMVTMEAHVEAIISGAARERVWLLEHPPIYTAGTSAKARDLVENPENTTAIPVIKTPRGGQYTYHGPGQRVVYVMLDLNKRCKDIRLFIKDLECWIIDSLESFNIQSHTAPGRVGVWVSRPLCYGTSREDKIAAIGVRLRKWVTFHGISVNVEPDLTHFEGIVPCGISTPGLGVTSLTDLGFPVTMDDLDSALKCAFKARFGSIT